MVNLQTVNSDFTDSDGNRPAYSLSIPEKKNDDDIVRPFLEFRNVEIIALTAGSQSHDSSAAVSPLTGTTTIRAVAARVCMCAGSLSLSLLSLLVCVLVSVQRQAPPGAGVLLKDSDPQGENLCIQKSDDFGQIWIDVKEWF